MTGTLRAPVRLLAWLLLALPVSPASGAPPALTRAQLENFTYDLGAAASVEGGKVPLVAGRWTDPDGGSTFTLHALLAFGDLDADGAADAVVVLTEATTGTGTFTYLFAIGNDGGVPVQRGEPEWLGDRSIVERLAIDRRGVVVVRYVTHKDGDPACCPTLRIDDRYRLEHGRLAGVVK